MLEDKDTIGFFDKNADKYIKADGAQGKIYMNFSAFENQTSEVCYIPELSDVQYTYSDFLKIAKGNKKLAEIIFEMVDWQHPEALFDELLSSDEIDENGKFLIWEEGNEAYFT